MKAQARCTNPSYKSIDSLLEPCDDASVAVHPGEGSLDDPSPFVAPQASIDGTLIDSFASAKSFQPKEAADDKQDPPDGNGFKPSNPDVDRR